MISVLVSAILLYVTFINIDVKKTFAELRIVNLSGVPAVLVSYFLMHLLIALRWRVMLNAKVSLGNIFYASAVHNMLNNLLPFRTGEASFVILLKKLFSVPVIKSSSILLYARIFDALSIFFWFLVSGIVYKSVLNKTLENSTYLMLYIFSAFLLIFALAYLIFKRDFIGMMSEYFKKNNMTNGLLSKWSYKISTVLKEVKSGLIFNKVAVMSVLLYLLKYTFLMLSAYVFGLELNIFETIIAGTVVMIATVLPIQGVAGFGTIEAGWVLGLYVLGVDKETAVMVGVGFHIIQIIMYTIMGGIGIVSLHLKRDTIKEIM